MDRREVEVTVAKVTYMRGLLALPLGAVFTLIGLGNLGWSPLQRPWVFFLCVAFAGAISLVLRRYYNDHYGRVTPANRARYAIATVVFGVAVIGGPLLDTWLDLNVSLFAGFFALAMLCWYQLCVELRTHHIVIWGALFGAALVPIWNAFGDPISVAWLPIAAATIVAGILDHRALVRAFGPDGASDVLDGYVGA